MPLSIQHQADSAGDKAVSLIADNSGSNVAAAFKGVNKATQNGDTVADLVVSLDGETVDLTAQYADGATFTRGSSKLLAGLAGIYESTVTALTAGKVALARLTARGAVVVAQDWRHISITPGTPTPSGSDITTSGGSALASTDLAIRDTSTHTFLIPMDGFRNVSVGIQNDTTAHDQTLTVSVYAASQSAATLGLTTSGKVGSFILPTTASIGSLISSAGAIGEGGSEGGATAAALSYYSMPGMAGSRYVILTLKAGVTPTAGQIKSLEVSRW